MNIAEIILLSLLLIFCFGLIFFYYKYSKVGADNLILKYEKDNLETKYKNVVESLNDIKVSTEKEMESWKKKLENESKEEIKIKTDSIASEYEDALKEEMSNLDKKIEEIDGILGERLRDILSKNTLFFTCVCDKSRQIPCTIDFSQEENKFMCDRCGAEYRVEISAYPVLLSNVSSNKTLAALYDK